MSKTLKLELTEEQAKQLLNMIDFCSHSVINSLDNFKSQNELIEHLHGLLANYDSMFAEIYKACDEMYGDEPRPSNR
jgi:hypothetical protein